jgi:hypothetical protein
VILLLLKKKLWFTKSSSKKSSPNSPIPHLQSTTNQLQKLHFTGTSPSYTFASKETASSLMMLQSSKPIQTRMCIFQQYLTTHRFHPIFLGGVNVGSGNKPPWTLPAKADYSRFDSARARKHHGNLEIELPLDYPPLTLLVYSPSFPLPSTVLVCLITIHSPNVPSASSNPHTQTQYSKKSS